MYAVHLNILTQPLAAILFAYITLVAYGRNQQAASLGGVGVGV